MSWATDDLAQLHVAPDREFVGFAQGILREWNPDTFENVVEVGGGSLPNLQVASGVEALTYAPGDVLMVAKWKPGGKGAATYTIGLGGRVIVPGPGAAERAIAFMRTTLAESISAEIFAHRVHSAEVPAVEDSTSSSIFDFTDLATAGPAVSADIGPAGKALVLLSADINLNDVDGQTSSDQAGYVGFQVSGASSVSPDINRAARRRLNFVGPSGSTINEATTGSKIVEVTGLNEGVHTFAMKYSATDTGHAVNFGARALVVIAF